MNNASFREKFSNAFTSLFTQFRFKEETFTVFTDLILNQRHDVSVTAAFYTSITMSYMDCAI